MQELTDIYHNGALHHAYLIVDDRDRSKDVAKFVEENLGIPARGNPDVHIREYNVFGIDNAREIQSLESKRSASPGARPTEAGKKIFILSTHSITREAQNAFLKTLEEPTAGTHFFILMRSPDILLPTLLSRMHVVKLKKSGASTTFARQFLSSPAPERLALIKDIIESKNKPDALLLIDRLEQELHDRTDFRESEHVPEAFEALQSVRSYLTDRSSSVKILLEYLSVTLPRIS
ncbi:hypothetical protein HYW58_00095 [Candidatus Kaiserbacteria bacterium]|nr:hypothetical protein [Candidatus Kaiserbacteria bacterium]